MHPLAQLGKGSLGRPLRILGIGRAGDETERAGRGTYRQIFILSQTANQQELLRSVRKPRGREAGVPGQPKKKTSRGKICIACHVPHRAPPAPLSSTSPLP